MRVLAIPEDPTHNGYILKPLAEALLADAGRPAAKVNVLTKPRLTGFDSAVAAIKGDLRASYRWYDLWLFFPDADRATATSMRGLEGELRGDGIRLLCCAAQPEVEIYACAGVRADAGMPWAELRAHRKLKEAVFPSLLARHGDPRAAGAGRAELIARSLANLPLLYQLCPELRELRDRIAGALQGR